MLPEIEVMVPKIGTGSTSSSILTFVACHISSALRRALTEATLPTPGVPLMDAPETSTAVLPTTQMLPEMDWILSVHCRVSTVDRITVISTAWNAGGSGSSMPSITTSAPTSAGPSDSSINVSGVNRIRKPLTSHQLGCFSSMRPDRVPG